MKSGHGGKRQGAGKKKGTKWKRTLAKEAAFELYRQTVLEKMEPIVQAQVDLALAKDGMMLRYLTDQVVGQPVRRVEHTGEAGGPIDMRTTVIHELHPAPMSEIVKENGTLPPLKNGD